MVYDFTCHLKSFKFEFLKFCHYSPRLLSFSYHGYCLTIALKWFFSFRCTIESRYLCYYVTSLKKLIDLSGKGKVISRSFKYRTANIMSSLRFFFSCSFGTAQTFCFLSRWH